MTFKKNASMINEMTHAIDIMSIVSEASNGFSSILFHEFLISSIFFVIFNFYFSILNFQERFNGGRIGASDHQTTESTSPARRLTHVFFGSNIGGKGVDRPNETWGRIKKRSFNASVPFHNKSETRKDGESHEHRRTGRRVRHRRRDG